MSNAITVLLVDDHAMFRAGIKALLLTGHAEEEYLVPVVEAGASGYLTKTSADTNLMEAIKVVARGQVFLAAEGRHSREIGKKLFISPKTVDTYRSRIMDKLGLSHRSELVRFALRVGLLKEM